MIGYWEDWGQLFSHLAAAAVRCGTLLTAAAGED
jgi:hypothetical protein